jgi:hypothetical protein
MSRLWPSWPGGPASSAIASCSKYIRANITRGWKWVEWLGGEERRGERREAGYKFTADLDTRTKKFCEIDKWTTY